MFLRPETKMAASLQNSHAFHRALISTASSHQGSGCNRRRGVQFQVRADASPTPPQGATGRRQAVALGAVTACISLSQTNSAAFAAEAKKGFQGVLDKKDGYSFLYPFGWQEVVVEGQDKVFKDVIEPLETVSVIMLPTKKEDIRDLGPPQEVVEALIKKVLAPASQKTKLVEASEHDVDGKAYYTFEFVA